MTKPPETDLFQQAVAQHQAGQLRAAEAIYERILQHEPGNADCLHLLGVARHQQGDNDAAIRQIREAIEANGSDPAYYSNLGAALRAAGRLEEAADQFNQAVQLNPDYATGQKNLGVALDELGRAPQAVRHLQRAVALDPRDPGAWKSLGACLHRLGRQLDAVHAYSEAVVLAPDDPLALNNLGVACKDAGQFAAAAEHFRRALQLRPQLADAHNNLGTLHAQQGQQILARDCFRDALAADPGCLDARHNLGVVLRDLGQLEEAIETLEDVVGKQPDHVDARNNLAAALQSAGQIEQAATHYRHALRVQPGHVWARFNRSTLLLLEGDFEHGWPEYEWRWKRPGAEPRRFPQPLWDGSDGVGTILLHAEQGLGDTLQFIRYADVVGQRCQSVIVECQPPLLPLLAGCDGVSQLFAKGDQLPDFDVHAPLMSLPGILGTTLDTVPDRVPYIPCSPELIDRWRRWLGTLDGFTIGIGWQGNPEYQRDYQRSVAVRHFQPLAEHAGVRLVSLQKGAGGEQLAAEDLGFGVADLGQELDASGAFLDTAALMRGLDLIVTSDTAVAHLAGAVGAPVWLALSYSPDWRWLRTGDRSPWYPSMRLFRQPQFGDWETVFRNMSDALVELIDAWQSGR